jgi:hypothetical protein
MGGTYGIEPEELFAINAVSQSIDHACIHMHKVSALRCRHYRAHDFSAHQQQLYSASHSSRTARDAQQHEVQLQQPPALYYYIFF